MKKIYLLLSVCFVFVTSVQAQRKVRTPIKTLKQVNHLPKSPEFATNGIQGIGCDTLIPFPVEDSLTLYGSFDYGFVSGINTDGDKEKANYFDLSTDNYNYISGVAVYFGYGNSMVAANLSKNVLIKVYADVNGQPGAQIGSSTSIPLSSIKSDVDNNFITDIPFSTPLSLPSTKKFYVSVDVSNFSYGDDSIAILSTDDSAIVPGIAWDKWSDDSWHNISADDDYGLNIALAIFPYVSTTQGACGVLPVKLISFDAERKNKDAFINWKVAEEINMKGYQLEKAASDNNYKPVTFIPAHNDTKNVTYSYTDANAFANAGNIQYRLKQIDNDGKVQYSKVISLEAASALNNITFTNPFNGSLHMQLNLSNPSQVKINVYDVKGSLVGSEKPASYGASSSSINLKSTAGLNAGMYFIKLMVGNETYTYKVMKQ